MEKQSLNNNKSLLLNKDGLYSTRYILLLQKTNDKMDIIGFMAKPYSSAKPATYYLLDEELEYKEVDKQVVEKMGGIKKMDFLDYANVGTANEFASISKGLFLKPVLWVNQISTRDYTKIMDARLEVNMCVLFSALGTKAYNYIDTSLLVSNIETTKECVSKSLSVRKDVLETQVPVVAEANEEIVEQRLMHNHTLNKLK